MCDIQLPPGLSRAERESAAQGTRRRKEARLDQRLANIENVLEQFSSVMLDLKTRLGDVEKCLQHQVATSSVGEPLHVLTERVNMLEKVFLSADVDAVAKAVTHERIVECKISDGSNISEDTLSIKQPQHVCPAQPEEEHSPKKLLVDACGPPGAAGESGYARTTCLEFDIGSEDGSDNDNSHSGLCYEQLGGVDAGLPQVANAKALFESKQVDVEDCITNGMKPLSLVASPCQIEAETPIMLDAPQHSKASNDGLGAASVMSEEEGLCEQCNGAHESHSCPYFTLEKGVIPSHMKHRCIEDAIRRIESAGSQPSVPNHRFSQGKRTRRKRG